jgi:hypothetical protein
MVADVSAVEPVEGRCGRQSAIGHERLGSGRERSPATATTRGTLK